MFFFLLLNDPACLNDVELSESHISKGDFSSTVALGAKRVTLFQQMTKDLPRAPSPFDILLIGSHLHLHVAMAKQRPVRLELSDPSKGGESQPDEPEMSWTRDAPAESDSKTPRKPAPAVQEQVTCLQDPFLCF